MLRLVRIPKQIAKCIVLRSNIKNMTISCNLLITVLAVLTVHYSRFKVVKYHLKDVTGCCLQ